MESPNMYDATAHQVGQPELKKSGANSANNHPNNGQNANNNNNNNNNNNSTLQVNANGHHHNNNNNNNNNNTSNTNNNNNNNNGQNVSKVAVSKASLHQQYVEHCAAAGELTDLNNPEISLDFQHLIDDSNFNDGLLDILGASAQALKQSALTGVPGPTSRGGNGSNSYARNALAYMPQPVHSAASYHNSCSDSNSSSSESPSIKEEPLDAVEFRRHCQQYGGPPGPYQTQNSAVGVFAAGPTFTTLQAPGLGLGHPGLQVQQPQQQQQQPQQQQPQQQNLQHLPGQRPGPLKPGHPQLHHGQSGQPGQLGGHHPGGGGSGRKQSKSVDKASDEYRRRRERNNIAVRKSREKAKVRSRETEERVKLLVKENDMLRRKVESLGEELGLLKNVFTNCGILPENIQRELTRHLGEYQQHLAGPQM